MVINGTGVQTTTNSRWGDYTSMNVDPVDDCTFWYVNEYYEVSGLPLPLPPPGTAAPARHDGAVADAGSPPSSCRAASRTANTAGAGQRPAPAVTS